MIYRYIKFSTLTYAEKARALLLRSSISSQLKRNPDPNHKEGCNYALFVEGNINYAYELIEKEKIPSLGVDSYRDRL